MVLKVGSKSQSAHTLETPSCFDMFMTPKNSILAHTDAIADKISQSHRLGISEEQAIALCQTESDIGALIDRLHKAGYTPLQIMDLYDRAWTRQNENLADLER